MSEATNSLISRLLDEILPDQVYAASLLVPKKSLELQPQCKLDLAWGTGSNRSCACSRYLRLNARWRCPGRRQPNFFQRQTVLGAIEKVKHFTPKLKLGALTEWNAPRDTKVGLPQIRPPSNVAWCVAVAVRICYGGKSCGIDPVAGRASNRLSSGWSNGNTRNQIGACIDRIACGDR
jgi:hypothetical protein